MLNERGVESVGQVTFFSSKSADLGAASGASFLPAKTCSANRNKSFTPNTGAPASWASISLAPANSFLIIFMAAVVRENACEQRGQVVLLTTARFNTTAEVRRLVSSSN